ncbi:hypothetical protein ACPPVO_39255 [Dactylosporangium sp. McL0621]|uniref:hypothetical protein n=1 Tax=Dactylosporangium sp. McL0621 TaxID=3415678 RepID=UPI003CEFA386
MAVVAAWLVAALGGLAAVPYAAFVWVFVAVLILPAMVAFWDSEHAARRGRPRLDSGALLFLIVQRQYRLGWLIVTVVLGSLAAASNMFGGFASIVVAFDGELVHAALLRADIRDRPRDAGYDEECVLARPDGRRIPGAVPMFDDRECETTQDVVVDPHGLVDPVPQRDDPGSGAAADALLLGLALASCVPAGRPRRASGPADAAVQNPRPPSPHPGRRRRRLRRKRSRRG